MEKIGNRKTMHVVEHQNSPFVDSRPPLISKNFCYPKTHSMGAVVWYKKSFSAKKVDIT